MYQAKKKLKMQMKVKKALPSIIAHGRNSNRILLCVPGNNRQMLRILCSTVNICNEPR